MPPQLLLNLLAVVKSAIFSKATDFTLDHAEKFLNENLSVKDKEELDKIVDLDGTHAHKTVKAFLQNI
tara:strand:+ start:118 stop:321 length:204 start_codon:yes stop_codon:yes gene_type:complete